MKPHTFKKLVVYLFPLLSIGCASYQLWGPDTYKEDIDQYYLAQDGSILVVGPKYHYIFSDPKGLAEILRSEHSEEFHAVFGKSFKVSRENNIAGKFKVVCNCFLPSDDLMKFVEKNNFQPTTSTDNCGAKTRKHFKEFELSGVRYLAKEQRSDSPTSFNRYYEIIIELESPTSETLTNIILTPLAVAIDAVNTAGIIVLGVASSPIIAVKLLSGTVEKDSSNISCNS